MSTSTRPLCTRLRSSGVYPILFVRSANECSQQAGQNRDRPLRQPRPRRRCADGLEKVLVHIAARFHPGFHARDVALAHQFGVIQRLSSCGTYFTATLPDAFARVRELTRRGRSLDAVRACSKPAAQDNQNGFPAMSRRYGFRDPITHPEALALGLAGARAARPCPATRSPSSSPDPARPAWRRGR